MSKNYFAIHTDSSHQIDESGYGIQKMKVDTRLVLAQRDLAVVQVLSPDFLSLVDRLKPGLDNLEADVDRVEKERCLADPHLAKALKDVRGTPFAGPNPILEADMNKKSLDILQILLDEYATNSLDDAATKASLQPILRSTLTAFWSGETSDSYSDVLAFVNEKADPLVWYCAMLGNQDDKEYIDAAQNGLIATKKRDTHPLLVALIATKVIRFTTGVGDIERGAAIEESIESLADVFQKHQGNESLVKYAFYHFSDLFDNLGASAQIAMATTYGMRDNPTIPDWIVYFGVSRVCSAVAMAYRGGHFISEVPPENLKLFQKYAELQSRHLKKAWVGAPDVSTLSAQLLDIEARAGSTGRSSDVWFRHVLSAKLDDGDALDGYTQLCMSRWGGSDEKLLWLSNKLAECIELDSDIGYRFWYPIRIYSEDYSNAVSLARPDALSATLKVVDFLKHREDKRPVKNIAQWRAALIARTLWDAGQLEDLRWFLSDYGGTIEYEHARYFRFDLDLAKNVCRASDGEGSACWQTIVQDLILGSMQISESKLRNVQLAIAEAEALASDDESREAVEVAKKLHQWLSGFCNGETVDLDFTETTSGWFVDRNSRVIDRSTIEFDVVPLDTTCLLSPLIRFAYPYSAEADVMIVERDGVPFFDPSGIALQAGPIWEQDIQMRSKELRFSPSAKKFEWDDYPDNFGRPPQCVIVPVKNPNESQHLRIEYSPSNIKGYVNGEQIGSSDGQYHNYGIFQIGRQTIVPRNAVAPKEPLATYRVSNVRIRRVDRDPAPVIGY